MSVFDVVVHSHADTLVLIFNCCQAGNNPVLSQLLAFVFMHENYTNHSLCLISFRIQHTAPCQIFGLLLFLLITWSSGWAVPVTFWSPSTAISSSSLLSSLAFFCHCLSFMCHPLKKHLLPLWNQPTLSITRHKMGIRTFFLQNSLKLRQFCQFLKKDFCVVIVSNLKKVALQVCHSRALAWNGDHRFLKLQENHKVKMYVLILLISSFNYKLGMSISSTNATRYSLEILWLILEYLPPTNRRHPQILSQRV